MSNPGHAASGNKIVRVLKHEIAAMLPPLVFFLVGFNMIAFSLHLGLQPYGIAYNGAVKASIGALVIAKVVLIVDHLPFARNFAGRPLFRPVLFRSVVYTAFAMLIHVLEEAIRDWVHTGSLAAGIDAWVAGIVWPQLLFVALWVFVMFLGFVTFDETRRAYGLPTLPRMLWARDDSR